MLMKYRPRSLFTVRPFGDLQEEFDRWFGDFCGSDRTPQLGYRMDVHEDAEQVTVEAELPGLTKEDIEITLEEGVLTIQGEKKLTRDEDHENYHLQERRHGSFRRSIQLPSTVDQSKVTAKLQDGVLRITLDKLEELKPKRIEVQVK